LETIVRTPITGSPSNFNDAFQTVAGDAMQNHIEHAVLFWPSWPQIDLNYVTQLKASLRFSYEIVTVANISNFVRRNNRHEIDSLFLQRALQVEQIHTIFYWDTLKPHELPFTLQLKCRKLEEFHDSITDALRDPKTKVADIGFFGSSLSASRGLVEFVWLAYLNPKLRFVASGGKPVWTGGYLIHKSATNSIFRKLLIVVDYLIGVLTRTLSSKLQNITFELRYSPTQLALNTKLLQTRFVFTAGHIHPYSSGIALQSLALGIPLIWTSGNSAISDYLTDVGLGGRLKWRHFLIPNSLTNSLRRDSNPKAVPEDLISWETFKKSLATGLNIG
jgi:hypothetical protein